MKPFITISLPCYGRPERTKRSIQCILDQDIYGWEAFIMGDHCPVFQELIDSLFLENAKFEAEKNGNILNYFNAPQHYGGCGYMLTNHAILHATGDYFVFFANDDVILPSHFSNYLSEIQGTDYDFVYYTCYIEPWQAPRYSKVGPCQIGHSELIVKTSFIKAMPLHDGGYGHDWRFIENMVAASTKYTKANSQAMTYIVKHIPNSDSLDTIN